MIKFFKSLLLFLVFTLPALADSLTINLNEFTANDGRNSDNQTNCVIQDKYGFIWIGTKDGLNRFDGKSFQVFKFQSDKIVSGNNITLKLQTTLYYGLERHLMVFAVIITKQILFKTIMPAESPSC